MAGRILSLFIFVFALGVQAGESCRAIFAGFQYPPLIESLDLSRGHTIEDVRGYLTSKMGAEVLHGAANKNTTFIVIQGAGDRAAPHFPPGSAKELANGFGAFNVVQVNQGPQKMSFVFTNVNGESRYLQVLSFLKLAGIPAERVFVRGRLETYQDLYRRTFAKIGDKPDLVVFGFSNTSFESMVKTLVKTDVLAETLLAANKAYAEKKWQKPGFLQHELQNMGVQVVTFKNGKKVWLIDNEYGDRATVLMNAMQDFGVKNVLLLGTAGALNPRYRVGELVSPYYYSLPDGRRILSQLSGNYVREGVHVHVDSPALETKIWLRQQLERKVDFVDVELQKVSEHVRPGVHYDAHLVISDVINAAKPQDYTHWTEEHRQQTQKTLLPILGQALKNVGIEASSLLSSYKVYYFETTKSETDQ